MWLPEVDHDKIVMGIATAAPTGTIRAQAALERRFNLWGIWRIHLFQNNAEVGAASVHWAQVTVNLQGLSKGPNTGCKTKATWCANGP